MTATLIISPPQLYMVNGEACKILSKGFNVTTGNNQSVIAAISGKIIRVMGWTGQSVAGVGQVSFKDGSGGTKRTDDFEYPDGTTGLFKDFPIIDGGYFETTVSVGLFADVTTKTTRQTVFYIAYTP